MRSVKEIMGYVLQAEDGEIGRCKDFLLDDQRWTVRYMVADTGKWLPGRKVLISPVSLGSPDWGARLFPIRLTKKQIEDAPKLQEQAPVHRRYEVEFHAFYGWPFYWAGAHTWGPVAYPAPLYDSQAAEDPIPDADPENCFLRSVNELMGYHIEAVDGDIGHIEEFIVDDESWTVRYMVIDTRNWLPGRKVLIPPTWIESADWLERTVAVDLTRGQVERSPEYDPSAPVNREYESKLYDFYGRPHYWE